MELYTPVFAAYRNPYGRTYFKLPPRARVLSQGNSNNRYIQPMRL